MPTQIGTKFWTNVLHENPMHHLDIMCIEYTEMYITLSNDLNVTAFAVFECVKKCL